MQNDFKTAVNNTEVGSRFQMAESLFFYLLDKILRVETRTKPNIDLKILLTTDTFITTLIACCVEIVINAYQSQMKFPWILKCFSITAFHFHKIIEIVVRSHDGVLSRPLIKHLNYIEESCLESLTWQKESPLWDIIKTFALPTWSEVDVDNLAKRHHPQMQSPSCSAYETFSSTVVNESTRRDLFNCTKEISNEKESGFSFKKQLDNNRRTASLIIFCRKFYKLAWIRLKELCRELKLTEEPHLNKLWTLFEHSITQRTELMQDRHLDQMLMCGIYLYIRVQEIKSKSFMDIMKFYRKQPQAQSSTYREVLIEPADDGTGPPRYRDIIYFYNNLYVKKMTPYALIFSGKKQSIMEFPEKRTNDFKKLYSKDALRTSTSGRKIKTPKTYFTTSDEETLITKKGKSKEIEHLLATMKKVGKQNIKDQRSLSATEISIVQKVEKPILKLSTNINCQKKKDVRLIY
ncbi:retinoblastoma family protein-like [Rhagoletis pomonella]|uniref:retinoblastoma family protein-like n=2 Tax=Rhagoletis TaxID=28609 RepID=UPI0017857295|nr:retinoblastoma family protein-like [Rhagoletis pomonella]